jgi:hypothetical protein
MDSYVRSMVRVSTFAQYLRYAAYTAAVVWALMFVSALWIGVEQATAAGDGGFSAFPYGDVPDPVIILYTAQSTWGYLLAAVVAFALSGVLESKLADEFGELGDDAEDDDAAGGTVVER